MTASTSNSHIKHHRPYFTPAQVERLSAKQRGKLSLSREERARQHACGFIDAVGVRSGFPRRTIATAQTLYMRFHLFFPLKDFNCVEVALSTLYVSSKIHDTLKKPRDIILSSYALRFLHLVKKGVIDPSAVDPNALESERMRVLSIERLVLETMCFKFGVDTGLGGVVKVGRAMSLGKELCQQAWRVAVDCYRTPAPLSFPPHVIALGSLYTASMLLLETTRPGQAEETNSSPGRSEPDIVRSLGNAGAWEAQYSATAGQADDIAHYLLDLYVTILSTPTTDPTFLMSSPSPVSPKDPIASSPAQHASSTSSSAPTVKAFRLSAFWTAQTLTELKIHLRDRRPSGTASMTGWVGPAELAEDDVESPVDGMGQNDGTVRFLWDGEIAA